MTIIPLTDAMRSGRNAAPETISADDQALLQHFGIFGPPTIAFYGTDGRERPAYRVVGYMKADDFAARTRAALHAAS